MSDLTDKIRAKYPDDYKDMSDSDLENAILTKYPEYKDLTSAKVDDTNTLSDLWNKVTKPTVNLVSDKDVTNFTTPNTEDSKLQAELKGFIAGAMKGGSDLVSGLSSPLNLATAGMGSLEELTGSNIAKLGTKILSAPVVAHGAKQLLSGDSSLGDRFNGGIEIAGGLLGLRPRAPALANKMAEAPSSLPYNNSLPEVPTDVARDFSAVGEEGNLLKNDRSPFKDTEEAIYENAKNRFGMGHSIEGNKPNLTVDQVNDIFSNQPPLKEGTTINFGNKPKSGNNGPKVTSLKPATPELIKQAQEKGPDTIFLKTADKTQLENAGVYGYKFEGIESDGSLRLKKSIIPIEDNVAPPNEPPLSNGGNGGPPDDNGGNGHIGDIVDRRKATIAQEVMNLPRGIMASWDLSAPFRQGLGLIHRPEWWKSWGSMFKSFGNENAFRAVQDSIAEKPLFKSFDGQPSFAEKAGLKLSDLTDLNSREEQIMSTWAEKVPGVRPSNRAYTAFLNKLRADTFESLMDSAKVINKTSGEIDMKLASELANYVNNATGRGSLGSLEKYAPALNSIFFSPRLIASRLQMLNPVYYMTASPVVRKEAIKSLMSIAGAGQAITQLGKLAGGTIESNPTSSDFGKLKVGNTRIDPYGGFQQYIVAANRLLQGKTTSSVSGKETDLTEGKFGRPTRFDVAERFGESKLNPLIGLATTILRGKNLAGQKVDLPEEVASKFIPLFIQDLKNVATENPNLIPGYNDLGLNNTDVKRGTLALPGAIGMGIQNYPSK